MQVSDEKILPRTVPRTRAPYVLHVIRPRYKVPPCAVYKPESKWTVVVALILAVALHIGAVAIFEVKQEQPVVDPARNFESNAQPAALD